jgi:hypothetical protein
VSEHNRFAATDSNNGGTKGDDLVTWSEVASLSDEELREIDTTNESEGYVQRADVRRLIRALRGERSAACAANELIHVFVDATGDDDSRDALGQHVRAVWIAWAREQPNPKPSWLVPWEGLSEPDREVDRMIGEALYKRGRDAAKDGR